MSGSAPIGLQHQGDTVVHRTPVGAKLTVLVVLSLLVVVLRGPEVTAAGAAVALLLALVARLPLRLLARATRTVLVIALVAAAFQWWWYGAGKAAETLVDLLTLTLLGFTVTATTPVNAMLDTLSRGFAVLRPFGVDPARVALTVSLAIGALPATFVLARETRDAARARGLDRSLRAHVAPFVVRVVARAHETGAALAARGLDD